MKHRIVLKPLEPYFFGSEKNNSGSEKETHSYFISSEYLPSQTTLFGALRYLGIVDKAQDFSLSAKTIKAIGPSSYDLTKEGHFGGIKGISPLYLMDQQGDYYIKTPFDHKNGNAKYSPFDNYVTVSIGMNKDRLLPLDFKAKEQVSDGFMRIVDGCTVNKDTIFNSKINTGIDKKKIDEAFFKMEYRYTESFQFVFFADLDEPFPEITDQVVFLGKKKSAFSVRVDQAPEPSCTSIFEDHPLPMAYALSNLYLSESIESLHEACFYSAIKTNTFRVFTTDYNKGVQRFKRNEHKINLIEAGSVFVIRDQERFLSLVENAHAKVAGFNHIILGGKIK